MPAPLDVAAAAGVLQESSDSDNDPLTAVLVTGPAHSTEFTLNADGSFHYRPAAAWAGADSFTYKVYDGAAYALDDGRPNAACRHPTEP